VEQALWAKHIDDALAREVLDDIDDAAYVDILRPMLRQKRKSTTAKNDYELNMKLMKWAIGRGFTMDIIRQCITVDNDESEFPDEDF
jgi:regulatory protein